MYPSHSSGLNPQWLLPAKQHSTAVEDVPLLVLLLFVLTPEQRLQHNACSLGLKLSSQSVACMVACHLWQEQ
jgi:hypothetical protein